MKNLTMKQFLTSTLICTADVLLIDPLNLCHNSLEIYESIFRKKKFKYDFQLVKSNLNKTAFYNFFKKIDSLFFHRYDNFASFKCISKNVLAYKLEAWKLKLCLSQN